jgi:hypothetical protein
MTCVGNMGSSYQRYGNASDAEDAFRVRCHWKTDYEKQLDSWTNEGGAVGLRSKSSEGQGSGVLQRAPLLITSNLQ